MGTQSQLLLPPRHLSSCIAACIVRDTRGVSLNDLDRMNYFPASPLFAVTKLLEGELHLSRKVCDLETLRNLSVISNVSVVPPQDSPMVSWSPGPVAAITIGFFPDAWYRIATKEPGNKLPSCLEEPLACLQNMDQLATGWSAFCTLMTPVWAKYRSHGKLADWPGSSLLKDWTHHLTGRMAKAGSGHSVKALERRFKRWTGKNRRSLEFFAQVEELHRLRVKMPDLELAQLAIDAEFADQSHMGRALKRVTGFSPAKLNERIANEEAFWCYRLMGQRF